MVIAIRNLDRFSNGFTVQIKNISKLDWFISFERSAILFFHLFTYKMVLANLTGLVFLMVTKSV
jgi:hypothetical protein